METVIAIGVLAVLLTAFLAVFGPAIAFLMAAAFSGARHAPAFVPLHASCSGSKSHAIGLKIIPSATPSFASHRFSSASPINLRSMSVIACVKIGLPVASFGAIWFSVTGIHCPIARLDSPVRIAGSPEMMPSKISGNRCERIIASRPPVEQPAK